MLGHLGAVLITIVLYSVLAVSYYGWGAVSWRPLGLSGPIARADVMRVWVGWALTLVIFQAAHIFFALTIYIVAPILIIGIYFAFKFRDKSAPSVPARRPSLFLSSILGIGILAVLYWVSSRAMLPPNNYDSGLYHLNTIRWINAYPTVLGLGNLHGRLASNQSFFTYAAALNFYPVFGYGRSLANSFLLLLTIATIWPGFWAAVRRPLSAIKEHPLT